MSEHFKTIIEAIDDLLPNIKEELENLIHDNYPPEDLVVLAEKIRENKENAQQQKDLISSLTEERTELSSKIEDLQTKEKLHQEKLKTLIRIESVLEMFSENNNETEWNNKLLELLEESVIKKKELIRMSLAYTNYTERLKNLHYNRDEELEYVKKCEAEIEKFLKGIQELNDIETRKFILIKMEEDLNRRLKIYEFIAPERNLSFDNDIHETDNHAYSSMFKKSKSFGIRNKENGSIYRKARVIT